MVCGRTEGGQSRSGLDTQVTRQPARRLESLLEGVKAPSEKEPRFDRVLTIREALRNGTYHVSTEELAASLLRHAVEISQ